MDKLKIKALKELIRHQLNSMGMDDTQIFVFISDDEEMFSCGYGCPACTHKALIEYIQINADEYGNHTCKAIFRQLESPNGKKVN